MAKANFARKKALKGTQRSAVTRNINKLSDLLQEDLNDPDIIAQLKLKKSQLLKSSRSWMLELTPDGELEAEVEQADAIGERIELAVMKIDCCFDTLKIFPTTTGNHTPFGESL